MEPNLVGIMICQFNHKNFSRKSYQKLPRMDEKFGSPISAMTELLSASSCKRYVVRSKKYHFCAKLKAPAGATFALTSYIFLWITFLKNQINYNSVWSNSSMYFNPTFYSYTSKWNYFLTSMRQVKNSFAKGGRGRKINI